MPLAGIVVSNTQKAGKKAVFGSLYARYVFPKNHAEFYLVYGRNDRAPTLINILADENYPRAFVGGFRKLFPLKKKGSWVELAS